MHSHRVRLTGVAFTVTSVCSRHYLLDNFMSHQSNEHSAKQQAQEPQIKQEPRIKGKFFLITRGYLSHKGLAHPLSQRVAPRDCCALIARTTPSQKPTLLTRVGCFGSHGAGPGTPSYKGYPLLQGSPLSQGLHASFPVHSIPGEEQVQHALVLGEDFGCESCAFGAKTAGVAQAAHLPHKVLPFPASTESRILVPAVQAHVPHHVVFCHNVEQIPVILSSPFTQQLVLLHKVLVQLHCFFPFTAGQKHATPIPQVYQVTDRLQARQHVVVYMPPLPKHLSEDC